MLVLTVARIQTVQTVAGQKQLSWMDKRLEEEVAVVPPITVPAAGVAQGMAHHRTVATTLSTVSQHPLIQAPAGVVVQDVITGANQLAQAAPVVQVSF